MIKTIAVERKHTFIWYVVLTILMFFYMFPFHLVPFGIPDQLNTNRIASFSFLLIAIIIRFRRGPKKMEGVAYKEWRSIVLFHIPVFFYMVLLIWMNGLKEGLDMATILINDAFTIFIQVYALFNIFDDVSDFLKVVLYAVLVQTVIIWFSVIDPTYALTIDTLFNQSEKIIENREYYAAGLGCMAAPGLLVYYLGMIACIYFAIKRKSSWLVLLYTIMVVTAVMIARTGLLLGIIGYVFLLINLKNKLSSVLGSVLLVFIATSVIFLLIGKGEILTFFESRFIRLIGLFNESEQIQSVSELSFFQGYFHASDTYIPPLSFDTLIGTGITSGSTKTGIHVNVDGGYIRLYVAYGLILAVFFYIFLAKKLIKTCKGSSDKIIKAILLLTIVLVFIGEFKEWYIYSSCVLVFYFVIALLTPQKMKYESK